MEENRKSATLEATVQLAGLFGVALAAIYFAGWIYTRNYYLKLAVWSLIQGSIPTTVFVGNAWSPAFLVLLMGLHPLFPPRRASFFPLAGKWGCTAFMVTAVPYWACESFLPSHASVLSAFGFMHAVVCAGIASDVIRKSFQNSEWKWIEITAALVVSLYFLPTTLGRTYGAVHLKSARTALATVHDERGKEYFLAFASSDHLYVFEPPVGDQHPRYIILDVTADGITVRHHDQ